MSHDNPPATDQDKSRAYLIPAHRDLLASKAVSDRAAVTFGLRSVSSVEDLPAGADPWWATHLPGLLYPWTDETGQTVPQLCPDTKPIRDGKPVKYLWPKDRAVRVGIFRDVHPDAGVTSRVLIVEGTKQALAAWSVTGDETCVLGIAGCLAWMRDGTPSGAFGVCDGLDVFVVLDADAEKNRSVYDAGIKLRSVALMYGAASVKFVQVPAAGTAGLDDVLGEMPEHRRPGALANLIAGAGDKPSTVKPRERSRRSETIDASPFFTDGGQLKLSALYDAIIDAQPAALNIRDQVSLYTPRGVYEMNETALTSAIVMLLGDLYTRGSESTFDRYMVGRLFHAGLVLPERTAYRMLNTANGMLDLDTLEFKAHDPMYLSTAQLPVDWNPEAGCPTYEAWVKEMAPGQVDDLEEAVAQMLDPTRTPTKALFLFGPSRSGKSTFSRLMRQVAGPANVSGVSLHQLADDRFAAAELYGKMLNVDADVKAADVSDLSTFKRLTGEDLVAADKKYGGRFNFINTALFAFIANELPTVSETSRAYAERVLPFKFPRSFAGAEDPSIEEEMAQELPGILSRWVTAYRRRIERGRFLESVPEVRHEFEVMSDRVRQWVDERCTIHTETVGGNEGGVGGNVGGNRPILPGTYLPTTQCTSKRELASAFNLWATSQGSSKIGERKVIARLTSINTVVEVRSSQTKAVALNLTVNDEANFDLESVGGIGGFKGIVTEVGVSASTYQGKTDVTDREGMHNAELAHNGFETAYSAYSIWPAETSNETAYTEMSGSTVVFDLETDDKAKLWTAEPGTFVRVAGTTDGPLTDIDALLHRLDAADRIVGHNVFGFDLLALARHHGADYPALAAKALDTEVLARLADPAKARSNGSADKAYTLDALGERLLGIGKAGDLKKMAKTHGGYDRIPLDDPDYLAYLARDVEVTAGLAASLPVSDYAEREHRFLARCGQMTLAGFRVALPLLEERLAEVDQRRSQARQRLVDLTGMPDTGDAPWSADTGREALRRAFQARGVRGAGLPKLPKSGKPAIGSDVMKKMREHYGHLPAVVELADLIDQVTGARSVYGTVRDHLAGDRVHPVITARQASGRLSTTDPGLTVFGKRDGRHTERAIFLPEPGHVIVTVDLDQIDMRGVAGHAQDPAYIQLFAPGRDVHAEIAGQVFGDKSMREAAKAIGHGWNYGLGINGMVAGGIDRQLAERFDESMRTRFPRLVEYREEVRQLAASGVLLDTGFGRKMRPDPNRAYTQGPALMGQGTAADLFREGVLRLPEEYVPMLRALVHDEAVFSVPAEDAADIERTIVEAMSFEWRGVPITAGPGKRHGANWADVYE